MAKNLILWLIIAAVLVTVMNNFSSPSEPQTLSYSDFLEQVKEGRVERVTVDGFVIIGKRSEGDTFKTIRPAIQDNGLIGDLLDNNVLIEGKQPEQQSIWTQLLVASFPILVIIAVFMFFMRQMQGGAGGKGGPMSFGKSKARLLSEDQVKTTFADVAGCDEAKEEVHELVEFLRDPGKFQRLGGRIPRGVLMVGPPGTGKTLLAKAIAGEAKVPFFTISGSDFVEMFVGVGASRVRDMFEQAKKHAPCIIFIDEIDAVGRHRGAGLGGGHDEREQTLNQLLVEMDGFEMNDGIIVIAATNRPDVLDPALLRPGRFDRQVVVGLPDIRGREQILKVHMRKVPISENVEPAVIARGTPGFSGADLANLVNEASLFAARSNKRIVEMREFELAKDKIMMGAERKSMVMSEKEKLNTAYHEAGHAIVGRVVPEHDPVYKVSIIPRGRALGVTMFLPEEDRYSLSKRALISQICSLFGGRIAEEMTLGFEGVTTGASNDIMRATQLARNMVTKWGLSEKLGPLMYAEEEGEVFLGRSAGSQHSNVSGETARLIDEEVRSIIDHCYGTAKQILTDNRDKLDVMAEALMKYETIDAPQIDDIMAGRTPREPRDWEGGSGASGTPVVPDDSRPQTPIGGPAGEH
ncbi:ATP-dependent zinc metalloprotease FtsH [Stutzerimonas kunmingensis]|mgnify:FL=1|jgi:cell division protease FtsH|uniref:ATP-dependent zinc metalloprotease FtsH n=3 Tax=Stutzerimonas TaxID=2901164 RepID=A0A0D7EAK7_STUST|nr:MULTISPECIES: ATP-dependent zinc metalloprotease FtsH [Stutzerimonas]MAF88612.1 ATP-dependent zinc metalloprotease FtsH [Pseudomonas sp.]MBU0562336.1 ATP-dependent zinc metalloprotease FtsH [Gammaproteobacteria bacterium]OCX96563.1 MAG: ATP-dependent metalloprotease [Pseudomonas sp. K35]KIZ37540.1 ATP-dependent metalloprotease [Stutzerimonas stutzeri]KKJ95599.1 ATP-dependent metalloprotease [Stutzerimonas stutzeri]|tara:strand:+ start:3147 stop:5057 length:1911 start_codon:yes stop_codon:yes gene_type:complete